MSDLIRRKDAIEVVCELVPIRNDAVEIADAIRAIPSADLNSEFSEWARHWFKDSAERKGEWIKQRDLTRIIDEYHCSYCDYSPKYKGIPIIPTSATMLYCPNCGAKMKGADDE